MAKSNFKFNKKAPKKRPKMQQYYKNNGCLN